jgi:periplasmic protein TonB
MAAKPKSRRTATRLVGAVFAVLLVIGFVWFVRTMMAAKTNKPQRQVQVIQVIRPPPPPPPDQPPPPPPPEKTQEALPKDKPEPEPQDNQPPPQQPLGIDADASAGSDAFGLAARSGGSDLIGGTGNAPFAWYTNRIADAIRDRLSSLPCAKSAKGSLSMHVMVDAEGRFKQVQLATTTGNDKVDQCIASGLSSTPPINDRPPPGMPEQITVRVVARN